MIDGGSQWLQQLSIINHVESQRIVFWCFFCCAWSVEGLSHVEGNTKKRRRRSQNAESSGDPFGKWAFLAEVAAAEQSWLHFAVYSAYQSQRCRLFRLLHASRLALSRMLCFYHPAWWWCPSCDPARDVLQKSVYLQAQTKSCAECWAATLSLLDRKWCSFWCKSAWLKKWSLIAFDCIPAGLLYPILSAIVIITMRSDEVWGPDQVQTQVVCPEPFCANTNWFFTLATC